MYKASLTIAIFTCLFASCNKQSKPSTTQQSENATF